MAQSISGGGKQIIFNYIRGEMNQNCLGFQISWDGGLIVLEGILMIEMRKDSRLGLLILRDWLSSDFEEEDNIHYKILNNAFWMVNPTNLLHRLVHFKKLRNVIQATQTVTKLGRGNWKFLQFWELKKKNEEEKKGWIPLRSDQKFSMVFL